MLHNSTKILLFWLPLMVVMTIIGWTVFGALPGAAMTGDLIAWLLELPIVTCYAAASVGVSALVKRYLLCEIGIDEERQLHKKLAEGDTSGRWYVIKDRIEWLVLLILYSVVFFPHY